MHESFNVESFLDLNEKDKEKEKNVGENLDQKLKVIKKS